MTKVSYPVSLRLAARDIEQLKARAHRVSGTLTGIARGLIVKRRLVVLEGLASDVSDKSERIEAIARDLRVKFDALLKALSSDHGAV
jgi:hypothetical protein